MYFESFFRDLTWVLPIVSKNNARFDASVLVIVSDYPLP